MQTSLFSVYIDADEEDGSDDEIDVSSGDEDGSGDGMEEESEEDSDDET